MVGLDDRMKCLVVDTAPIIKSLHSLPLLSQTLITVPDVLKEIKDARTKQELANFTHTIDTKIPSQEAIQVVLKMAKETGDVTSLSITDVRVIALALQLEWENGRDKLKDLNPASTKVEAEIPSETKEEESEQIPEQPQEPIKKKKNRHRRRVKKDQTEAELGQDNEAVDTTDEEPKVTGLNDDLESECHTVSPSVNDIESPSLDDVLALETKTMENLAHMMESSNLSDSDDGEWITPSSLRKKDIPTTFTKPINVGIITDDFAMQNICLRLGLSLVSISGSRITRIKSWVLRCHACYTIVHNLSKDFCPRCGNATLLRTSVQATPEGLKIFLKKDFQYRNRGTVYSIPKPQTGRRAQNLILREDQKEYQRAVKAKQKMEKVQDVDLDFGLDRVAKTGHIQIGYGRKNVNEVRGRRRK